MWPTAKLANYKSDRGQHTGCHVIQMSSERYVALLRESGRQQTVSSSSFQVMQQHVVESDARLFFLQTAQDTSDPAFTHDKLPEKTRIITASDPFARTDQINGTNNKMTAKTCAVVVAVVGPFSIPFDWERFVKLWSASGKGLGTRMVEGHRLAAEHEKPFYVDLVQDYMAVGDGNAVVLPDDDDDDMGDDDSEEEQDDDEMSSA